MRTVFLVKASNVDLVAAVRTLLAEFCTMSAWAPDIFMKSEPSRRTKRALHIHTNSLHAYIATLRIGLRTHELR